MRAQQAAAGNTGDATASGAQSDMQGISGRGNRACSGSKDKAAVGGAAGVRPGQGQVDRRQTPASIATEADGSWARKTFN